MKLIELLVKELPKRGGWPDDVNFIAQDSGESANPGEVFGYTTKPQNKGGYWTDNTRAHGFGDIIFKSETIATDCETVFVTYGQYEATLAESLESEPETVTWDGNGLPPVGLKVEWFSEDTACWLGGTVAAHDAKYKSIAIIRHNDGYTGCERQQIRTPAERQRENAINEMASMIGRGTFYQDAEGIYSAIAAGKIPGVTLTQGDE